MNEVCSDNRFEVIRIAKERLLAATNIDTSPDEMKVLDNFLFRCWQMGWLDRYEKKIKNNVPEINVGKWISCSVRLPEDYDNRFYMCIVENHEEDLPMFLQYVEDCGFGYWYDIYDKHTLGFVDSEFKTNEELGYEKVIAWQPLPKPYHPDKCHGCFGAANNDCRFCEDDGK